MCIMLPPPSTSPDPDVAASNLPADTVLVVEDDPRMQRVLHRLFTDEGYRVVVAGSGRSGLASFRSEHPILVILDLILPEISGRDLCRDMKTFATDVPIIIVSAVTDVVDKVLLIELGADDYVTKPFSPRELMARAQSAIRRSRKRTSTRDTVAFGACVIDFTKMLATCSSVEVALTSLEFKVLRYLTANTEQVISREALLTHVWGYHSYPSTRTVDNLILKLRQKLEREPANPRHLITVHGVGYKFIP